MAYGTPQFNKSTSIAGGSSLNPPATGFTLTTPAFGSPAGNQILVIDSITSPSSAVVISCTISGTAVTGITYLDGATTANHAAGASVTMAFTPAQYTTLIDGSGWTATAINLGEAPITGDQNLTGSFTDMSGMSLSPTIPNNGRRVRLDVMVVIQNNTSTGGFNVAFLEDGTIIRQFSCFLATTGFATAFPFWYTKTPTAGAHTYKVQVSWSGAGTGIAKANSDLLVTLI